MVYVQNQLKGIKTICALTKDNNLILINTVYLQLRQLQESFS